MVRKIISFYTFFHLQNYKHPKSTTDLERLSVKIIYVMIICLLKLFPHIFTYTINTCIVLNLNSAIRDFTHISLYIKPPSEKLTPFLEKYKTTRSPLYQQPHPLKNLKLAAPLHIMGKPLYNFLKYLNTKLKNNRLN